MLTKEEKAMSKPRRCIKGHYFDGLSIGFGIGSVGGALLFRSFEYMWIIPAVIAIVFYLSTDWLERKSYNMIKDVVVSGDEQ